MEFTRRGPATTGGNGDVSDGRRIRDFPPHRESMLVIRDALQAQLQKDRLRQEIIEAELAKIDRAMALRHASLNSISDVQSYSYTEEFMMHRGFSGAAHDLKEKDERHGSLELKPWNPVMGMGYRIGQCSTDGRAGQESKMLEPNETEQPRPRSLTWELTEVTLPVNQPKVPERWSCTVCQVETTSEHNLQEHFAGQKHQANVASLGSRNNGGMQQTAISALQQTTARDYVHVRPPTTGGKLPLNGSSSSSNVASSEMTRHMMTLYFCKVCNVQCSSEVMFEDHRRGKLHKGKAWKLKVRTFCKVCKLQCNSDEMLANHLAGKKHQKNARLKQ